MDRRASASRPPNSSSLLHCAKPLPLPSCSFSSSQLVKMLSRLRSAAPHLSSALASQTNIIFKSTPKETTYCCFLSANAFSSKVAPASVDSSPPTISEKPEVTLFHFYQWRGLDHWTESDREVEKKLVQLRQFWVLVIHLERSSRWFVVIFICVFLSFNSVCKYYTEHCKPVFYVRNRSN